MKGLNLVTLDFETYFAKDYSLTLKGYTTSGYIRDPQYKSQCVGIKLGTAPVVWVPDRNVAAALQTVDWSASALLAHHVAFDGFILSHHYGIVPAYYLDTLSMGRALHSQGIGGSLNALASFYKLGNKLPDVLNKTKGIRDLSPELMTALGQYCAVDVELCYDLFHKMVYQFPQDELDLIDLTARMFCDPVLHVDTIRAKICLQAEIAEKKRLVEKTGLPKTVLSSNPKFAAALEALNVTPPLKTSPTTGKQTYAFAKNDAGFQALQLHADPRVRDIVEARIATKSTINETRAARLIDEGDPGPLPVYLKYYGAHTGRWSGGNKVNLQNLQRGGELRRSIIAPPGHQIVVADSAQIEARMLAWLADDEDLLEQFRASLDVYKVMASAIYAKQHEDITKTERFVGKVAVLGLGYGMGAPKFQNTLSTGAMGPPVELTSAKAYQVVNVYRQQRKAIKDMWVKAEDYLAMLVSNAETTTPKGLRIDGPNKRIYLPNDMYLSYPGLQGDEETRGYIYFDYLTATKRKLGVAHPLDKARKIYGGLLVENITQALARIVVSTQMLAVVRLLQRQASSARPGKIFRVVTMTHDEIVSVVPTKFAQYCLDEKLRIMRTPPAWCADIPLDAEGGFDRTYSK